MEMLCPECLGPLNTEDGRSAVCTAHGGRYEVLFRRGAARPVSSMENVPAGACPRHPTVAATGICGICAEPLCDTCAFPQANGTRRCAECATGRFRTPTATREWLITDPEQPGADRGPLTFSEVRTAVRNGDVRPEAFLGRAGATSSAPVKELVDIDIRPAPPPLPVPGVTGATCRVHPSMPAVALCNNCASPICATCDFVFPGNIHLCSTCATTPQTSLGSGRKSLLWWSYGLAIWTTLALVIAFAGALDQFGDERAAEAFFSVCVYIPAIIGTGTGFASMDRRLGNPASVWGAVIWNSILLGILILLVIIGLTMG